MSAEAKLAELGLTLPSIPSPIANYVPFKRDGHVIYLSGQGPRKPDGGMITGKVGQDVTAETAYEHAKLIGLQLLAAARQAAGGSLDRRGLPGGQRGAGIQGSPEGDQRLLRLVCRGARRARPACPLGGRDGLAAEPDHGRDRGRDARGGVGRGPQGCVDPGTLLACAR